MNETGDIIGVAWWVFDLVTLVFLLGSIVAVLELIASCVQSRHWKWWKVTAIVLLVIGWLVVFWGSFIESRMLTVNETYVDIASGNADREVRVAVVSDIHVGPYKQEKWVERVVNRVNELDVEVVLIPGDFIFHKFKQAEMLVPLADLEPAAYATLGNHDENYARGPELEASIEALERSIEILGVEVLRNENTQHVFESGAVANIVGIDDLWFEPNPVVALDGIQEDQPTIMMSHNPDFIMDPYAEKVDLVVSGHTHCGQIRLPLRGSVPPVPTELGNDYDCGLFEFGDNQELFISAGVGETGPRARLLNPPTIDVLTIKL